MMFYFVKSGLVEEEEEEEYHLTVISTHHRVSITQGSRHCGLFDLRLIQGQLSLWTTGYLPNLRSTFIPSSKVGMYLSISLPALV